MRWQIFSEYRRITVGSPCERSAITIFPFRSSSRIVSAYGLSIEAVCKPSARLKTRKPAQSAVFPPGVRFLRSEEHTSELQLPDHLVCRLLLEKKKHNHQLTT